MRLREPPGQGFGDHAKMLVPGDVLRFLSGEGDAGVHAPHPYHRPHHGARDRQCRWPGDQLVKGRVLVEQVAQDGTPGALGKVVLGIRSNFGPLCCGHPVYGRPQRFQPVALDSSSSGVACTSTSRTNGASPRCSLITLYVIRCIAVAFRILSLRDLTNLRSFRLIDRRPVDSARRSPDLVVILRPVEVRKNAT